MTREHASGLWVDRCFLLRLKMARVGILFDGALCKTLGLMSCVPGVLCGTAGLSRVYARCVLLCSDEIMLLRVSRWAVVVDDIISLRKGTAFYVCGGA